MNLHRAINFLSLCLLLTSCAIFKNDPNRQLSEVQKDNFEKAEGQFVNFPLTTKADIARDLSGYHPSQPTLWSELGQNSQHKDSIETIKAQTVMLDFISKKRINATLLQNGEIIHQETLRGSIRRGYFYYKRRFLFVPFFPLFFQRHHSKYRLALTSDDLLVIDYCWNDAIFALIAGDYSKGQSSAVFNRK